MKKTLLISMPFGALERPALGLSLLKARLHESNLAADVRYLNFAFAEYVGLENYHWINYELPYTAFAGDWLFTQSLYGAQPDNDKAYIDRVLRDTWRRKTEDIERLESLRTFVPHFLDYCLTSIAWDDYAIVGFTSTFEQNIASLALARRIKTLYPHLAIVFGGANWEAGMGEELHRQFPFVDFVCSGEAEETLPHLVATILNQDTTNESFSTLPGIVYRHRDGASIYTGHAAMVRDMDALPIPDYTDYFRDLHSSTLAASIMPILLFETSRGCWWGAKSHCTFCGLNGGTMAFRSKSPRRALDELEFLADRWRIEMIEAVDNILDMKYFDQMLPALARANRSFQIFYEVKANLSREHVAMLSRAGVTRIQPGIESMSDHVLKLMRKGTTALRNIQLLKWCKEYGVTAEWNILYGFPGETEEDYRRMLELFPAIRFLNPPSACGPVRMDRFSPYFNTPSDFGLTNVRPLETYRYLYPFAGDGLHRLAYYFDYDYEPQSDPRGAATDTIAYAADWLANPEPGTLSLIARTDGTSQLIDTRRTAFVHELTLTGLEHEAYNYCDEFHPAASVVRHLRRTFPRAVFDDNNVKEFLDSMTANLLMVSDGENYLSLALRVPSLTKSLDNNEAYTSLAYPPRPASSFLRPELKVLQAPNQVGVT
ncbi:MAG: RiPP maturation radical SAM C-methyltransferase [Pyrinomonadaceae bacterium MAG19_C2-C3]|nr:RiPP maturation radical SAM C-methyltransferase [Pyrinomonadaceae bacterium MAG19_C2-C3]